MYGFKKITTFIKEKLKKSDDQTTSDKYRVAVNIAEYFLRGLELNKGLKQMESYFRPIQGIPYNLIAFRDHTMGTTVFKCNR